MENADAVQMIIRRDTPPALGIGSHAITTIGWLRFADLNGYSTTVDLMTFENTYRIDTVSDPWQFFFLQPSGISPIDAIKLPNKIVSGIPSDYPDPAGRGYFDPSFIQKWRDVTKRHIVPSPLLIKRQLPDIAFTERKGKTLGVLARGTDYTTVRPRYHAVQPDVKTMIEDADRICDSEKFDNVFLVTEDQSIVDSFRRSLKTHLIVSRQRRMPYDKKSYLCFTPEFNHNIDTAVDYVSSLINLSVCEGILAGRTSGSMLALLMSNGFSFQYFYDMGLY